ncbi:ESX-1 secretion-associated protein [Mycolicibacterium sp. HK-90]|uniref:ESX-1 secretion-associated protein n=1 Tax=Mycolicibacterium sp. HK-90 TaxID=3056937 RepID=UPI00265A44A1|nr:ESX-1 secretion-associated protein [Mycolicibacterium sp. HK-90]WKG02291.1 ESX-1 secretion-associated protein [Mycolicibacterium sp. HK-90]
MKVIVDDLRATSGVMDQIASGFYNDGGGPILKSVTSADSELDSTKACGELGDIFLAYAQTLGQGVSEHAGNLSAAAGHYERGDTAAAEAIDFDPPEERELEVGDDPGEPGYDPVHEYEAALQEAGLLDGPSSGMYREWLQNAADNDVPPETIVEIARQENITPASFDVLKGLERVTNKNDETNLKDDTDFFMLPENVSAEQARQAALMTYIFNAGTGYGTSKGSTNNDFAETPYSAAEVQRIKDRQEANSWSYDLLEHAGGGAFATTPNGMLMGVGGGPIQQLISQQGGTCVGDVFAVNIDNPIDGGAAQLRDIIQSGTMQSDADHDGILAKGNDLDRVLHHEERHSQQWADEGRVNFLRQYFWPTDADPNPFETNAGGSDGGYH